MCNASYYIVWIIRDNRYVIISIQVEFRHLRKVGTEIK
jgi:hypothetical protein